MRRCLPLSRVRAGNRRRRILMTCRLLNPSRERRRARIGIQETPVGRLAMATHPDGRSRAGRAFVANNGHRHRMVARCQRRGRSRPSRPPPFPRVRFAPPARPLRLVGIFRDHQLLPLGHGCPEPWSTEPIAPSPLTSTQRGETNGAQVGELWVFGASAVKLSFERHRFAATSSPRPRVQPLTASTRNTKPRWQGRLARSGQDDA